jgi:catechol 2,3-dioxygenase-like lactoylglutathione lyase family enzyme
MKLSSISGVTYVVKDLKQTADFYEALGFRLGKQDDNHLTCYVNWFWMDFIVADQQEADGQTRGAGTSVHLKVESADEFYDGVIAKGMTPDGPPQGSKSSASGRSFALRDPDGYKLLFFEKK